MFNNRIDPNEEPFYLDQEKLTHYDRKKESIELDENKKKNIFKNKLKENESEFIIFKKHYEQIKNENEELLEDRNFLKAENNKLFIENTELKNKLKTENNTLNKINEILEEKNKKLKTENDRLTGINEILEQNDEVLEEKNKKLENKLEFIKKICA
jgi:chromosome segregation ATPase